MDFPQNISQYDNYMDILQSHRINIAKYLDTDFSLVETNLSDAKEQLLQKRAAMYEKLNEAFCSYSNVYIYGTGAFSRYVNILLQQNQWSCTAYVVSDHQKKPATYNNKPVLYLSQVKVDNDNNIFFLAVSQKHLHEIQQVLSTAGHKNYEFIDLDIMANPLRKPNNEHSEAVHGFSCNKQESAETSRGER